MSDMIMKLINKNLQNSIYVIFWIVIFSVPFILSFGENHFTWMRIFHESFRIFPFFIVFWINNLFLFDIYSRKKYTRYAFLILLTVSIISVLNSLKHELFLATGIPLPPAGIAGQDINGGPSAFGILTEFVYTFLISFLFVGVNNSVKVTFNLLEEKKNREEAEHNKTTAELAFLQHQVNPHFFMNTLNNILALVDFDKEKAKDSLIKLSKLMRVMLYEKEKEGYSLNKEIGFINDYIDLMKIRTKETTDITFEYPKAGTDIKLEPFLFINFIENAFKHGIKATGNSYIHIRFALSENDLTFEIRNSKKTFAEEENGNGSVGLENSRKRLEILYGDRHSYEQNETDSEYSIKIRIPVKR